MKTKGDNTMQYILMSVFAILLIGLDQFTKFLTVSNIPLHEEIGAIPGLFHFTYVQNTGAAFSMMEGKRWVFVIIVMILLIAVVWEFYKKALPFKPFERWCIATIVAGGISNNLIDRAFLGYVVDMIEIEFVNFAVFNVADCFVVCGCILLMIHLIFFNKEFWKETKEQDK
jgi:signal peptidase II